MFNRVAGMKDSWDDKASLAESPNEKIWPDKTLGLRTMLLRNCSQQAKPPGRLDQSVFSTTKVCRQNHLGANLAAQLSLNAGQRILVVDADPQCNLSQYLLDDASQ